MIDQAFAAVIWCCVRIMPLSLIGLLVCIRWAPRGEEVPNRGWVRLDDPAEDGLCMDEEGPNHGGATDGF